MRRRPRPPAPGRGACCRGRVRHEEAHHLVLEEADLEHPPLEAEEELPVAGEGRGPQRLVPGGSSHHLKSRFAY